MEMNRVEYQVRFAPNGIIERATLKRVLKAFNFGVEYDCQAALNSKTVVMMLSEREYRGIMTAIMCHGYTIAAYLAPEAPFTSYHQ